MIVFRHNLGGAQTLAIRDQTESVLVTPKATDGWMNVDGDPVPRRGTTTLTVEKHALRILRPADAGSVECTKREK